MQHQEAGIVAEMNDMSLDLDIGECVAAAEAKAVEKSKAEQNTLEYRAMVVSEVLDGMNAYHINVSDEYVELMVSGRNVEVVTHKNASCFNTAVHQRLIQRFNPSLADSGRYNPDSYLKLSRETDQGDKVSDSIKLHELMMQTGRLKKTRSSSLNDLGPNVFNEFEVVRPFWIDHTEYWANAVPEIDPRLDEILNCLSMDRDAEKIHIMQWLYWRVFGRHQYNAPALCISGAQGSGKGLLAHLMQTAMHGNTSVVNVNVGTEYQDGFAGAGVLYLDEQSAAQKDDKWIKSYVGNGRIRINPKGVRAYMADVTYMVYATSNERKGALYLSQDVTENRRMSVLVAGQSLSERLRGRGITERTERDAVLAEYAAAVYDSQAVANLLKYVEQYHRPDTLIAFHGDDYLQILGHQQNTREADLIELINIMDEAGYTGFKLVDAKKVINTLVSEQGGKAISDDAWLYIVETAEKQTGWKLYDKQQRWPVGKDNVEGNRRLRQVMSKYPNDAKAEHHLAEYAQLELAFDGMLELVPSPGILPDECNVSHAATDNDDGIIW
ncbi:primase-helicase family protein [Aeromonas veronii]|uniref:primase-helicase family protein n=1 Tax=Aeromonas veronii TaxID=654 RepID=UPI003D20D62E